MMDFIKKHISGIIEIKPKVFRDGRGYFFESYNYKEFKQNGIPNIFVQDNESYSIKNTIRGLHYQKDDFAQAKLVRVVRGTVLDVAVDLRPDSPTYGQHIAVELCADTQNMLFIPRGFAHGFSVLSGEAVFFYKCDTFYHPESEGGIRYDSKALGINWRVPKGKAMISPKDLQLPYFDKIH